jgi:Conjugal transfer protein
MLLRTGLAIFGVSLTTLGAMDPNTTAREITYHEAETPAIYTQLGFVTAVYLPKNETIMWDADHPIHTGNAEFFNVTASGSVLYIKPMDLPKSIDPSTGGKSTDIAFDLASGNHMQFIVQEVSKATSQHADLKVFIKEGDDSQVIASQSAPRFVPATELDSLQKQLDASRTSVQTLQAQQSMRVEKAELAEAQSIKTNYEIFDRKGKDKFDASVWRDDKFTYVKLKGTPVEAPTLWEVKDDKPFKTESVLQGDTYTVQHLIDIGELRVGKSSLKFKYEKE